MKTGELILKQGGSDLKIRAFLNRKRRERKGRMCDRAQDHV